MTRLHRAWRGIDHSAAIAFGVARALNAPTCRAIWKKPRRAQRALSRTEREKNMSGAFVPHGKWRLGSLRAVTDVIVVDDVTTTGATLRAACKAVRGAIERANPGVCARNVRLWCAVVGVTPEPGRKSEPDGRGERPDTTGSA